MKLFGTLGVIGVILLYLFIVNLISFCVMGIDKRKAIKQVFRIPESTLFIWAIIGGSVGSLLGMYTFRHKTRKPLFVYGMPLILIVQIILVVILSQLPIHFLTL